MGSFVIGREDDGDLARDLAPDGGYDVGVVRDDRVETRRAAHPLQRRLEAADGEERRPAVGRLAQLLGELMPAGRGDEDVSHGSLEF